MKDFQPDYRHFADVMNNKRPERLPLYEHLINATFMEKALDVKFAGLIDGNSKDICEFFRHYCLFFREMTYDVVSFEMCIVEILPEHGALFGGKPGPIQNRADFEKYPWDELPKLFWEYATPKFNVLSKSLPAGMKAVGGIGNGVFEISEDLVGLEYLPFIQADDPELYCDLFIKIGDLMETLWKDFLPRYADSFVACRFGDDLGFKTSSLTNPKTVCEHILPQYKRIIDLVHSYKKPFLWHSCGNVFEIMDDVIALGINAKHSNEDSIAPFSRWIDNYGDRIALVGGFDLDFLSRSKSDEIFETVRHLGRDYRSIARGYALGSGNSIPDYIPVENYLAMIKATQSLRENKKQ
jgi:uroporphyrinogen decarboxylase